MSESVVNTSPVSVDTATSQPNSDPVKVVNPHIEKMKINGKEVEVSLDELKRSYGLHMTATQRFEEANKLRAEAEQIKKVFSQKEVGTLLQAGWTEEEIEQKAAEYLVNKQLEKNLTPQQREAKMREQEYKRLKEAEEKRVKDEKEKVENELRSREAKLYQTAFMSDVAKADNKTWLDLNDPIMITHIINDISSALTTHGYDMGVQEAVHRLEQKMSQKGPAKKEYLKKLLKGTITEVDDNDIDAFLDKGGKGIREKSGEIFKKSTPFDKKSIPQVQSAPPSKSLLGPDYYKSELQKARDKRYKRL